MKRTFSGMPHAWLVMMKAAQALGRYGARSIREAGLGDSDFRVLEALLHKGPLPVNTIGPKVDLTPGSISVAVERLHQKGLLSRTASTADRRVRIVRLTTKGRERIVPVFRQHADAMKEVFGALNAKELAALEAALKKVGKRAEERMF